MTDTLYYSIFTIISRYILMAAFGYFASAGYYDSSLIDSLTAAGLAIICGGWVLFDKWLHPKMKKKKFVDPNQEFTGGYDKGGW